MNKGQKRHPRQRPISRKKGAKTMSSTGLITIIVLLISITAFVQLRVHTHIASLNMAIDRQTKALEEMDKTYKDLSADLDAIKNSDEIMKKAKFQLGMVYPENDQVKYIEIDHRDKEHDVNENVYLNPVISVLHIFNRK